MPTLIIDTPDFLIEEAITLAEIDLIIDALWLVPQRPDMHQLSSRLQAMCAICERNEDIEAIAVERTDKAKRRTVI